MSNIILLETDLNVLKYMKPELLIVSLILYFIGITLIHSKLLSNRNFPKTVFYLGISISITYVILSSEIISWIGLISALIISFIQGVICGIIPVFIYILTSKQIKKVR